MKKQYKNICFIFLAEGKIKYSTDTVEELHLKENGKETSLFVYWDASGFQINDVYEG